MRDVHNQKFVFISESAVPLYPPTTMYQELIMERTSRIDACRAATVLIPL